MTSLWSTDRLSLHVYTCLRPSLCDRCHGAKQIRAEHESREADCLSDCLSSRRAWLPGEGFADKWRCTWWREACPNRSISGYPARLGTSHAAIPSPTCLSMTDRPDRANSDADVAGPMSMSNAIHVHVHHPTDGTHFFCPAPPAAKPGREGLRPADPYCADPAHLPVLCPS